MKVTSHIIKITTTGNGEPTLEIACHKCGNVAYAPTIALAMHGDSDQPGGHITALHRLLEHHGWATNCPQCEET